MPPKNQLPPVGKFSPLKLDFSAQPRPDASRSPQEKSPVSPSPSRPSLFGAPERQGSPSSANASPVRAQVPQKRKDSWDEKTPLLQPDATSLKAGEGSRLDKKKSFSKLVKKKFSENALVERYREGKKIADDPESLEWIEMGKSLRATGLNQKKKIPLPIAKLVAEMTMPNLPVIRNLTQPSEAIRDEILARADRAQTAAQSNYVAANADNSRLEENARPAAQREFGYAGESDLNSSGSPQREPEPVPARSFHRREATRSTVSRRDVQEALLACVRGAGSVHGSTYDPSLHLGSSDDEFGPALPRNPSTENPAVGSDASSARRAGKKLDAHTTAIEDGLFSGTTVEEILEHLQGIEKIIQEESISSGQFDGACYAIDRALAGDEGDSLLREKLDDLADLFKSQRQAKP